MEGIHGRGESMIYCKNENVGMFGKFKENIVPEFVRIAVVFFDKAVENLIKRPEDDSVEETAGAFMKDIMKFAMEHHGIGEPIELEEFFSDL